MSNFPKYTSISRIISKFKRDLDSAKITISDTIEWTGEALEFIESGVYQNAVAFLTVENHEAKIPNGLVQIKEVLFDSEYSEADGCIKIEDSESEVEVPNRFDNPLCIDSCGNPINSDTISYSNPYIQKAYGDALRLLTGPKNHNKGCSSRFLKMRATNSNMFDGLFCYKELGPTTKEYKVKENGILEFSFESGQVAISYLYHPIDEKGYPLIPDNISYTTAIVAYINYKITQGDFYNYVAGSQSRYIKAEQDWHWYCKQSSNLSLMPNEELLGEINDIWRKSTAPSPYGYFGYLHPIHKNKFTL